MLLFLYVFIFCDIITYSREYVINMFKIAIFSDVHGNLEALQAILSNMEKDEFDEIVCLGDVIGIGPNPRECLSLILSNNIKMVLGNHERYYLNGTHNESKMSFIEKQHHEWVQDEVGEIYKAYLSKLPIDITITVDDKKIGFMHYPFDKIMDDFYSPKVLTEDNVKHLFRNYTNHFTFFGHSHKNQFYKDHNDFIYVNVESVGCTKDDITYYTILEYDGKNYNIYKRKCIYDRKKFEKKLMDTNFPDKENMIKTFF